MKKLRSTVDDVDIELKIHKDWIEVNDTKIELIRQEPPIYWVKINGKEVRVDEILKLESEGIYRVEINGYTIDVSIEDPISAALSGNKQVSGEIIAPMSGQISNVSVTVGQEVNAGDVLLTISAMKMENQITSPIAGIVQNIRVKNNENVPSGKLLILIEPKELI